MARPVEVNDSNFEQVVTRAKRPVLVDFWAPSCKPCQAVEPIVKELANEYDGKVDFARINVDKNPKTASNYSIMSIPFLLLFKNGKPFKQVVGLRPKREFKKVLDASLT